MTNARFVPWVRATSWDAGTVTVRIAGPDVDVPFSQYGPGDVTGIALQQVRRRDPAPGSRSMPPNLFPSIEFGSPSLPWMLSPGAPDAHGMLQPWLALIVLPGGQDRLGAVAGAQAPVVEVPPDQLPPHDQLALWAHVQLDAGIAADASAFATGIARILAPYALRPTTDYVACLVPTFEAGRLAGLGKPVPDPRSAAPAWGTGSGGVSLPVYDAWAFTTTERGDLETVARRLTARDLSSASRALALDVGVVTGDVDGRLAPLLGALHTVGANEAWNPTAAVAARAALSGELERAGGSGAPVVGLPVYGSTASGAADVSGGWSRELNLDPRRRAAAGLGAQMVRDHQEALVDEAWRQAGDIDRARRERQGAMLADLAASRLRGRMVESLTAASALVTMAPALARTVAPSGSTARALVAASAVPPAMLDASMRRIAATKLPRAARSAGQGIRRAIAVQNTQMLFPGAPPPLPIATVTLSAVRAELAAPGAPPPADPGPTAGGGRLPPRTGPRLPRTRSSSTRITAERAAATAAAARTVDLTVTSAQASMVSQLLPIIEAIDARVVTVAPPAPFAWTPPPAPPPAATAATRAQARLVAASGIRFDLPIGVRTTPRFAEPLGAWLDPSLLLAGVELPPDTAGLLEVNGPFVEALLVGANHELAREMLWRGVPLDRQATYLDQFFEAQGTTPPAGLRPVREWSATEELGSHVSFGEQAVLILRSHLVAHLDQTTIFLASAIADGAGPFRKPGTDQLLPSFRGFAGLETAYFGFAVDEATLRAGLGWYLVIQELVGAVRFGLDEESVTPPRTWNDLGWSSVAAANGYVDATQTPPVPAAPAGLTWGADAAHMAGICLQRPIRLSIHTSQLLPPPATEPDRDHPGGG